MKQANLFGSKTSRIDVIAKDVMKAEECTFEEAVQTLCEESAILPNDTVEPNLDNETADAVNNLVESAMDAEASSSSVWMQTGEVVDLNKDQFENAEKKDMGKAFTSILNKNAKLDDLPETGESRTGEEIELRKANGKIKWSSWVVTARIVQNTSDIFKGIELLGYEEVFPGGILISRYELLAKIKEAKPAGGETPAETIIRCLEMVSKKVPELTAADIDSVEQRMIEMNVAFADFKAKSSK